MTTPFFGYFPFVFLQKKKQLNIITIYFAAGALNKYLNRDFRSFTISPSTTIESTANAYF